MPNHKEKITKPKLNKKFSYWMVVIVLVAFHIVFGLRTVAFGGTLSSLESEQAKLAREVKELNSGLVEKTSLIKLQETSESLGFVKPAETLYVSEEDSFAKASLN